MDELGDELGMRWRRSSSSSMSRGTRARSGRGRESRSRTRRSSRSRKRSGSSRISDPCLGFHVQQAAYAGCRQQQPTDANANSGSGSGGGTSGQVGLLLHEFAERDILSAAPNH